MKYKVYPKKLDGTVSLPPSKSIFIRNILCSLFGKGSVTFFGNFDNLCKDVSSAFSCAKKLGAKVEETASGIILTPPLKFNENEELNVSGSATLLRLIIPILLAKGIKAKIVCDKELSSRPLEEYINLLNGHGGEISGTEFPLTVKGKLNCGSYKVKSDVSSQYVSGLMIGLSLLDGESEIVIDGDVNSAPYIGMTEQILNAYGGIIEKTDNVYRVKGVKSFNSPSFCPIEGDYTIAAYYYGANAFGNRVRVLGLPENSLQGDKAIKEFLISFSSKGTAVNLKNNPDLFPIISAVSAYSCSKTEIYGIDRLKYKESDRVKAVSEILKGLNINADYDGEKLTVQGKAGIDGGEVYCYNDHRIIMSAILMGTCASSCLIIDGADGIEKSYPDFIKDFISLGGKIEKIN